MIDFAQSSSENKQSIAQQRRMMVQRLKELLKQLCKIEAQIEDESLSDDGQTPGLGLLPR